MYWIKAYLITILILYSDISHSQNGIEVIYRDTVLGIRQFNSFKLSGDQDKRIYIQQNESPVMFQGGKYFKLLKLTA